MTESDVELVLEGARERHPGVTLGVAGDNVEHYNGVRLHGAIGYVTPNDVLGGRQQAIWSAHDENLAPRSRAARQRRSVRAAA
jgi:hypothetical protein